MTPHRPIAHPEWVDDAVERLRNTLVIYQSMRGGPPLAGFMLATPAHRLLRAIYGGFWSVAWACLLHAAGTTLRSLEPRRLIAWRYKRAYGVSIDEDFALLDDDED